MKLKLKSIHSPLLFGIYATLTAIPMFIIFSLSASAIVICIISLFGYPQAPTWLLITLLPLLLNPAMGILGIVYGIIKIKTRCAMLITDSAALEAYKTKNRVWQGIASLEVTKRGRMLFCFYSGGVKEEIENYSMLVKSEDGINFTEPIAVAYRDRKSVV